MHGSTSACVNPSKTPPRRAICRRRSAMSRGIPHCPGPRTAASTAVLPFPTWHTSSVAQTKRCPSKRGNISPHEHADRLVHPARVRSPPDNHSAWFPGFENPLPCILSAVRRGKRIATRSSVEGRSRPGSGARLSPVLEGLSQAPLVGLLVALEHGLGRLPPPKLAEHLHRLVHEIRGKLPPEGVPAPPACGL